MDISSEVHKTDQTGKEGWPRIMSWIGIYRKASQIAPQFNRAYYLSQTEDKRAKAWPIIHYICIGAERGLDPAPEFSTLDYLQQNPDVKQNGVNPFWHFIRFGQHEGRPSNPIIATDSEPTIRFGQHEGRTSNPTIAADSEPTKITELEKETQVISDSFDTSFYRKHYYNLPDSNNALVSHYLKIGWILGYDPCDWFSTRGYIMANLDVAEARTNPFVHYILSGKSEDRLLTIQGECVEETQEEIDLRRSDLLPHFDVQFYLQLNPDVEKAGIDPIVHYLMEGFREGRDPHPDFSTKYYLEANPDVRDAGINPFVHYVTTGKQEGRHAKHPAGSRVNFLTEFSNLDEMAKTWKRSDKLDGLLNEAQLCNVLGIDDFQGRLILSISHDNYQEIVGGIQLCIAQEVEIANGLGDTYLSIFPWQPLPRLAKVDETPDVAVSLILNGKPIGIARMSVLRDVVSLFATKGTNVETVIHQVLGHTVEQIVALVSATGSKDCSLWLHDFITVCPSYTLQRNSFSFCDAPDVDSNACTICIYGQERRSHQSRMKKLFESLEIEVLAPSTVAKNIWLQKSNLKPASVIVVPHVKLRWSNRAKSLPESEFSELKVAFLGTQARHKGWSIFTAVAQEIWDREISFYYFGIGDEKIQGVTQVPVHVSSTAPAAMTDALSFANIDFVIHWASWPETFSLTTFEALAAGAFIVTNETSGNVAATVAQTGRGIILKDGDSLAIFLSGLDGRLESLLQKRRTMHSLKAACSINSSLSFQRARLGKAS